MTSTMALVETASAILPRRGCPSAIPGSSRASANKLLSRRAISSSSSPNPVDAKQMPPRPQRPNRLTVAYQQMQRHCPDAIQAYAHCIQRHQQSAPHNNSSKTSGGDVGVGEGLLLTKGSCESEFATVKNCFRHVRRQNQNQKT